MDHNKRSALFLQLLLICIILAACNNPGKPPTSKKVKEASQLDEAAAENIQQVIDYALQKNGLIDDSTQLRLTNLVASFYQQHDYQLQWSHAEKWQPLADSLVQLIEKAELSGLYPKDYQAAAIQPLKKLLDTDSASRTDASLWTKADLLMTDAFLRLAKDLKYGRLEHDSTFNKRTQAPKLLIGKLEELLSSKQLSGTLNGLQPSIDAYWKLKEAIPQFLDSMDRKSYTYVTYPYRANDEKDSLAFVKTLQKRLKESNCIPFGTPLPDTVQLKTAIKKFQQLKGIKQDGQITTALIKLMNTNDLERFKRIAITLDRYKQLPDSMPQKYIWVNLPGYYLQVWDNDTLALESKVICGKPATRTPILTSKIANMVTYPTWTVPTSIIAKQYLPKLKNNPNYLSRIGLRLVNNKGETVNPAGINWGKYKKGIPFKVMQSSGDDNALGVMKFNFDNPYAVYLHDTNQRYLFKNSARALSHGCVRVQEWEQLAFYLARNDSMNLKSGDTLRYTTDSIKNWLAAKERRYINVKNEVALFIRYFTCEGKDGKIKFYEDIYGEDKQLRETYFSEK